MNKRYQVFVSSTFMDLREERDAVINCLLKMKCLPASMEMFTAANSTPWEHIKRVIEESDYYVVVVGGRYGSLDADGLSYTEKEFAYAEELGIPILGFIHGDPASIPAGNTEGTATARRKLEAFKSRVRQNLVDEFCSPHELGTQVMAALYHQFQLNPRKGWVRGGQELSAEVREELATLRSELAQERLKSLQNEADSNERRSIPADARMDIQYKVYFDQPSVQPEWIEQSESLADLFGEFGELSLTEGSEYRIRQTIERRRANSYLPDWGTTVRQFEMAEFEFKWLVVYFSGLGLIEPGVKRRAADDDSAYWRLTDWGRSELYRVHTMFNLLNGDGTAERSIESPATEER